ncbi:hypothetical protein MVEN_02470300 [Mycena venus]|uniref:Uncharacterized protein n=1 Tax=Mycena venus TaxID=2733690 RepID=A0A8H6WX79_9AGAR|nr:hypothetical protein MVEN_02470300 [Mycena venus]
MPRSMRHLAQELVEQVLDALCVVEPNSMKACGLVCTGWVPRSRYHLFSSVSISSKNLAPFVDIIQASSLPILSFIQSLHLDYDGEPLWLWNLDWIHQCPNLAAIAIGLHETVIDLEPLHLHLCSWAANSGSISELKLIRDEEARSVLTLPAILEIVAFWHALTLVTNGGGEGLFSWLLSFPVIPPLKSFEYYGHISWQIENQMVQYFEHAGRGIESLTFERWWSKGEFPPDTVIFYQQIFPHTTALKNISLRFLEASIILDTLALLPASNLESITIVLPPPFFRRSLGDKDIEVPWAALMDAFGSNIVICETSLYSWVTATGDVNEKYRS